MSSNPSDPGPTQRAADQTRPQQPPRSSSGGGPATGGFGSVPATVPLQDLSGDKLIFTAPRAAFEDKQVPSLGGIPLIAKLGQGGMGAVYYGIHPRLQQEVAVKVLPFDMAERSPDAVQRFFREAQLAARVKSPHLVGVLDVNQESGLFYIVMEYVEGASAQAYLRNAIKSEAMGLNEAVALELCIAACTGLAAAHAKGIIHRDVKPDNIMIPRDEQTRELDINAAKLADLGLARSEALDSGMTQSGACMGTPGFMSPEQANDAKACGKPADVFSMGATLYALLTGHSPIAASELFKMLRATNEEPHEPVGKLRPEISVPSAELIDRCLAKDPAKRYVDAAALLGALKVCRAALDEPAQTQVAVVRVGEMVRAKEVGQPVPDSKQPITASAAPATSPPAANNSAVAPKKSRAGLWAALLLFSAGVVFAAWHYASNLSRLPVANTDPETPKEIAAANPAEPGQKRLTLNLDNGIKMDLELIAPGTFVMGSPDGEDERREDEKQHSVTISKAFYMARYPVTQEQYEAVMTMNPSNFNKGNGGGPKNPVERVSWNDAVAFCENLDAGMKAELPPGMKVQLPTEAQWEYACRAGTKTQFYTGNSEADLARAGWYAKNSGPKTHPVGQKTPNAFGLYDMHGNVFEWCQDAYLEDYTTLSQQDPINAKGAKRILRGGAWSFDFGYSRSANRDFAPPDFHDDYYGFRVVVSPPTTSETSTHATPSATVLEKNAPEVPLDLGAGIKVDLVLVRAGEFEMGADNAEATEKPAHAVKITRAYCIGKYPITVGQFKRYVTATGIKTDAEKDGNGFTIVNNEWKQLEGANWKNPGFVQDDDHPVVLVSWNDAQGFVKWASALTGRKVSLPSEAQWEYAARGPQSLIYPWGNVWDGTKANHADKSLENSGKGKVGMSYTADTDGYVFTNPVGKLMNASWCGACDMAGNVSQLCQDKFDFKFYANSKTNDPVNEAPGAPRVDRGGSWNMGTFRCRSSSRNTCTPNVGSSAIGFRVVVELSSYVLP